MYKVNNVMYSQFDVLALAMPILDQYIL